MNYVPKTVKHVEIIKQERNRNYMKKSINTIRYKIRSKLMENLTQSFVTECETNPRKCIVCYMQFLKAIYINCPGFTFLCNSYLKSMLEKCYYLCKNQIRKVL